jgi:tetratricopeptide (TPR) repeat protein
VLDAPNAAGRGFLLGCRAFALEELGDYAAAERTGRRAVEIEPEDAWGLHAVSHVHEMQGRTAEGIAWIERARPVWTACNNFGFHMAWHLALFHLELGDHARVLRLYDGEVRPSATDDFRDAANAASLLWRLETLGVAVGDRWEELKTVARTRRHDLTLAFASLHTLLTLVAVGDNGGARELVSAMQAKADEGDNDQAAVMDEVGIDLATTILDLAEHRAPRADFDRLATRLHRIGGSNAQRDVFVLTLAAIAADRGNALALERILAVRRWLKRDDRFVGLATKWLAQARRAGRGHSRRASSPKQAGISLASLVAAS